MGELNGSELTVFLLGLAILLASAHLLGELARRLGQPVVIGEMLAGLLLGPTFFGWLAPAAQQWMFPHEGAAATALDGIVILAVTLLLMLAGMEVDLSSLWRQGRATVFIAVAAVVVPLVVGAGLAWAAPQYWGMPADGQTDSFAIFVGTALAVSALPVIAKILMDLELFQTDFGVLVLVSATLNNLVAWLIFSVMLGGREGGMPILYMVLLTVGFALAMLTVGRWVADQCLGWVQAHLSWPAGVLGFSLVSGLLGAAFTDSLGVHAIFGAFLTGIALGESPRMREQTRHVVHRFVEGILAPIFVAAIGLEVNFVTNFRPGLVISVLVVGIATKVLSAWAGARLAGCQPIEAWGAGWALNARGELGIVLGLLAWQNGVISEQLFVAVVALALVTSALAGPMLMMLLRREKTWSIDTLLDARACVPNLEAVTAEEAIRALAQYAAGKAGLDEEQVVQAVLAREDIMGTGLGGGIAVPHARWPNLVAPIVVVGASQTGIPFQGVDDEPVRLIFLSLTPEEDPASQLQILASIGRLSHNSALVREAMSARTPTELLGALRVAEVLYKAQTSDTADTVALERFD
jgi:Kef-type K+ transport system membrane component KefB/mannitol/fructose-specific phosphotransferase system IIA component (Ntr-type)